jgi:hypothetical protein
MRDAKAWERVSRQRRRVRGIRWRSAVVVDTRPGVAQRDVRIRNRILINGRVREPAMEAWLRRLNVAAYGKPAALRGRGDVVGPFNQAGSIFLTAYYNWKF